MPFVLRLSCVALAAAGLAACADAPRRAAEDTLPGALLYAPEDAKWLPPSALPDFLLVADASAHAPSDRG